MNKDLIKKARQTNLAEYLVSVGIPLKQEGRRHRHAEHESLIFTENAYYWNSRNEHGNAIDYLVKNMDMNFVNAVLALTSSSKIIPAQSIAPAKGFVLDADTLNSNCYQAKIYLTKKRFIDEKIIDNLITKKLLSQDKQTNNIIFQMHDENNICVGAELQGVTSKRFKGVKENSKYGYGFNIRFSNDNTYDYALFFESAIDLISFIDYKKNHQNKSLYRCILISMAGLKKNVVKHTLKIYGDKINPVLCVDNDKAGEDFTDDINIACANTDFMDLSPDAKFKDWNEQLMAVKRRSPPVGRLLVRSIASSRDIAFPLSIVVIAAMHKPPQ